MNFLKFFPRSMISNLDISKDVHKAIIGAIVHILQIAEDDTALLLLELCISTSTGTWLNEWGDWFGVSRMTNESDSAYATRIVTVLQNPKVTINAIKENVVSYLNKYYNIALTIDDVAIFEPYTKLKSFSQNGTFDGDCRFPDAIYWRTNVIDICLPKDITNELISLIETVKAAGVKVYYTQRRHYGVLSDEIDNIIGEISVSYNKSIPINYLANSFDIYVDLSDRKTSGRKLIWKYTEIVSNHIYDASHSNNSGSPLLGTYDVFDADTATTDVVDNNEYQHDVWIKIGTDS